MDAAETLIKMLKKRPTTIIFGSFLHGSGRSFLADSLTKLLLDKGLKVVRISPGDIFRELARKEGKSIEEFVEEISESEEKARQVDLSVDSMIKERIDEGIKQGGIVIVDSNLAPFYAKGIKILVKTDPSVAGKRVFEKKRKSDSPFASPEEARKALEERTEKDLKRYRELSEDPNVPEFWRNVYRDAVARWGDESVFDIIVDNSGSAEEGMRQLINWLKCVVVR